MVWLPPKVQVSAQPLMAMELLLVIVTLLVNPEPQSFPMEYPTAQVAPLGWVGVRVGVLVTLVGVRVGEFVGVGVRVGVFVTPVGVRVGVFDAVGVRVGVLVILVGVRVGVFDAVGV